MVCCVVKDNKFTNSFIARFKHPWTNQENLRLSVCIDDLEVFVVCESRKVSQPLIIGREWFNDFVVPKAWKFLFVFDIIPKFTESSILHFWPCLGAERPISLTGTTYD